MGYAVPRWMAASLGRLLCNPSHKRLANCIYCIQGLVSFRRLYYGEMKLQYGFMKGPSQTHQGNQYTRQSSKAYRRGQSSDSPR